MQFEPLQSKKHLRKAFDCGVEALNCYLHEVAGQDIKRNLTRVYVLAKDTEIIGYYTLSAHSVGRENLPKEMAAGSYGDVPFLLLGRLAVDKKYHGKGYGDALICHAFATTMETAERIGILGIVVDAKDEAVARFYEGFGFRRLTTSKHRLVLPVTAMKGLF